MDFTSVRYAPVINCVLKHGGKILLVERNKEMRLYPGLWNGIAGFLDDGKTLEEKVQEEIKEETGLSKEHIVKIFKGTIFEAEDSAYDKVWIVHPVLVEVDTDKIKLDWEAEKYGWFAPADIGNVKVVPGFDRVLKILKLT
ncbi:MAG: NUDIX domain-containing protein [Candidatus Taylorbacteria bacterium]|nr:NUDIX domain-containing protein [Candidatus Taylorbacteria bacterium]